MLYTFINDIISDIFAKLIQNLSKLFAYKCKCNFLKPLIHIILSYLWLFRSTDIFWAVSLVQTPELKLSLSSSLYISLLVY